MKKNLLLFLVFIFSASLFAQLQQAELLRDGFTRWQSSKDEAFTSGVKIREASGEKRYGFLFFSLKDGEGNYLNTALEAQLNLTLRSGTIRSTNYYLYATSETNGITSAASDLKWSTLGGDIADNGTSEKYTLINTISDYTSGNLVINTTELIDYINARISDGTRDEICFVITADNAQTDDLVFHAAANGDASPATLSLISGNYGSITSVGSEYSPGDALSVSLTVDQGTAPYTVDYSDNLGGSFQFTSETDPDITLDLGVGYTSDVIITIDQVTAQDGTVSLAGSNLVEFTLKDMFELKSRNAVIASGGTYTLEFNFIDETAPYPYTVRVDGEDHTFNDGDTFEIPLDPTVSTIYNIESVSDGNGTYYNDELILYPVLVAVDDAATSKAPVFDAYIQNGGEAANEHKDSPDVGYETIVVKNTGDADYQRYGFVEFDLSGVTLPQGLVLLALDCTTAASGTMDLYSVDETLNSISSFTYNDINGTLTTTKIAEQYNNNTAGMVYFDVTDYVNGASGYASFMLFGDKNDLFKFASMETTTGTAPSLWMSATTPTDIEDEVENSGVVLYPNPASSVVNFTEQLASVNIYNISGKLVKVVQDVSNVNIEELPTGLYIVEVTTVDGKFSVHKLKVNNF